MMIGLDVVYAMRQSMKDIMSTINNYSNMYISKCKHVACLSCWNTWLEKTLECPACRTRTRKN